MEQNKNSTNEQSKEKKLNLLQRIKGNKNLKIIIILIAVIAVGAGYMYWKIEQGRIYIEKAEITAPLIDLSAQNPGVLNDVLVAAGDTISQNTPVARVGDELIKSKVGGIVVSTKNDSGKIFNPGEPVVSMIAPDELRVNGSIGEDKGLKDIIVGQKAIFTVDAFPGKEYEGTVDEVSSTSRSSDIVFSISDKREVKEFNIKVRFNIDKYPELKNGMSAKLWIYK